MKFKSKIDWWYYLVTAIFAVSCVWLTVQGFHDDIPMIKTLAVLFIILLFLMILPVIFVSFCTLNEDSLYIRCGFFPSKRIGYQDILTLEETRDPSSSMAPSLDRVGIEFKDGKDTNYVMVAPKEKQKFIDELRNRNPLILYKPNTQK